jgi:hypothetical protein
MEALFQVIAKIDKWLRQRYSKSGLPPPARIFWNQIMVTAGIIMLRQQNLAVTLGNLERYTPIPSSSIYRTIAVLESYGIIARQEGDGERYDFKGNVPKDILELTTNRAPIDLSGLIEDFRSVMKVAVQDALTGLNIDDSQRAEVIRKLDKVAPKKDLNELETMFGEGSFL